MGTKETKAQAQANLAAAQNQLNQLRAQQSQWASDKYMTYDPEGGQSQWINNDGTYAGYENPFDSQLTPLQEQIKAYEMQAAGLNPDGSPMTPDFQTILNPDGSLPDQYKIDLKNLDPNTLEGYNMIKQLATQQGPSKYAEAANLQSVLGRQDSIDAAARQSAGAQSQAFSQIASRGGAGTGSRERMAMNFGDNLMASKQGAYRQQGNQLLDIMKTDETMKRDAMYKFGEAEGKIAFGNLANDNQEMQYNLNNVLKEKDMERNYTMDTYKAALDKWGANKQAEATRNSGGGGGGK